MQFRTAIGKFTWAKGRGLVSIWLDKDSVSAGKGLYLHGQVSFHITLRAGMSQVPSRAMLDRHFWFRWPTKDKVRNAGKSLVIRDKALDEGTEELEQLMVQGGRAGSRPAGCFCQCSSC